MRSPLYILVGHSATGKTTMEEDIVSHGFADRFLISTTREKRAKEQDGIHYEFMSVEAFRTQEGAFVHTIEITPQWLYGYRKSEVEKFNQPKIVSFIEMSEAVKLKNAVGDDDVYLIVFTHDKEDRIRLMRERGESQESIDRRLEREKEEDYSEADLVLDVIDNDDDKSKLLDFIIDKNTEALVNYSCNNEAFEVLSDGTPIEEIKAKIL